MLISSREHFCWMLDSSLLINCPSLIGYIVTPMYAANINKIVCMCIYTHSLVYHLVFCLFFYCMFWCSTQHTTEIPSTITCLFNLALHCTLCLSASKFALSTVCDVPDMFKGLKLFTRIYESGYCLHPYSEPYSHSTLRHTLSTLLQLGFPVPFKITCDGTWGRAWYFRALSRHESSGIVTSSNGEQRNEGTLTLQVLLYNLSLNKCISL